MMKSVFFLFAVIFNFGSIASKSFQLRKNDFLDAKLEIQENLTPEPDSEGSHFFTQNSTSMQMVNENVVEKEIASENEDEITFVKHKFSDNSFYDILDGQNAITNDIGLDQNSETSLSMEMEDQNLTTAIIIDFSNVTGNAIVLDIISENSEDDLDEVSEMSKGEEIAFNHEMPTSNFEFLIDSQTRRNILLKELLGSQTILSVEEDYTEPEASHDLEHSLSIIDLHSRGDNFSLKSLNNKSASFEGKFEVDEMAREDKLNEATSTFKETELRDSSENVLTECPQPGWCMFWFLSQDTCAVNSHCFGSRICCKIGCSKTCVDA